MAGEYAQCLCSWQLQSPINLTNVSNVILTVLETAVEISVERDAANVCDNVSNFRVEGLSFVLTIIICPCKDESIFLFLDSFQIEISDCSFQGSGNKSVLTMRPMHSRRSNVTVSDCQFDGIKAIREGIVQAQLYCNITCQKRVFCKCFFWELFFKCIPWNSCY